MPNIEEQLLQIQNELNDNIINANKTGDFDELYLKYFSKTKGLITLLVKQIPNLQGEEKAKAGSRINDVRSMIESKLEEAKNNYQATLKKDPLLDLSYVLPPLNIGTLHPTTQVIRKVNDFFRFYGFSIAEGPEIENTEFNFRKLNLPEGHPATDLQDTLFIKEPDVLLRTHTSSVEARLLTDQKPPIRSAFAGKVYRNETVNRTNGCFFHHYQGVVVDKGITIQHLRFILEQFHKFLFGDNVILRFRYKYYPEVSPGMGTDMQCTFCKGEGCPTCKYRGWIEVLGSGMIHYNTLKMCGIDPEIYTGFAFGMGLDRLVMAKYGIDDIRKLYGEGLFYV